MALQEPAWRVKSRPCPFYQQGRCLFADSCNFVHSASIRVSSDGISLPRNTPVVQNPSTPSQIPIVTVNSPKSVRSPPRSPRLSGLLFALRDVIGDDPEEEEEEEEFDTDNHIGEEGSQSVILDAGNWSSGLPTLVNDNGFPLSSQEYSTDVSPSEDNHMQSVHDNSYSSHSSPHASPRVHPENSGSDSVDDFVVAETEDDTLHSLSQSLSPSSNDENDGRTTPLNSERSLPNVEQEVDAPAYITDPSSHLLSPVEISNLHLGPFLIDNHDYFSNSFDSGYADSYKPPPATIPPRSPARNSTFELLASPFGSPSQRILSPRVEEKAEPSAEYDLDSPTDYKTKRRSDNAEDTARICEGTLRLTPVFTPLTEILAPNLALQGDDTDSDEEYEQEQDSMGSTASWDAGDAATTAVFLGINDLSSSEDSLDDDQSVALVQEEVEVNSSVVVHTTTEPEQMRNVTETFVEEEVVYAISADDHEDFMDDNQPVLLVSEEAETNFFAVVEPEQTLDFTKAFVEEEVISSDRHDDFLDVNEPVTFIPEEAEANSSVVVHTSLEAEQMSDVTEVIVEDVALPYISTVNHEDFVDYDQPVALVLEEAEASFFVVSRTSVEPEQMSDAIGVAVEEEAVYYGLGYSREDSLHGEQSVAFIPEEAEANSITEPEQTLDFTEAFVEEEDIHVISADNHEDFLDIDQQVAFIPEEAEANSYMVTHISTEPAQVSDVFVEGNVHDIPIYRHENFLDDDQSVVEEAKTNSYVVTHTEPEQMLDTTEVLVKEEFVQGIPTYSPEDFPNDGQPVAFIPEETETKPYVVAYKYAESEQTPVPAEILVEDGIVHSIPAHSREDLPDDGEAEAKPYVVAHTSTMPEQTPNTKDVILEEEVVQYITVGGREEEDDVTAQLPYLLSPTAVYDDGDTLNSLYDVYTSSPVHRPSNRSPSPPKHSVFSSPHVLEKKLSSSSSTPSSLLRERVFTPPPNGRSRAGTITADSPNSLVSPLTSLDSQSRGRASPFSVRSSSSARVSEETSKKVPFGFRPPSLALDKRASLISNRTSRNVLPSLQRRGDALIPEEPPERISTLSPPSPADNGSRLRPLRLSVLLDGANPKLTSRMSTTSSLNSRHSGNQARISMSSASVPSGTSLSNNNLLSSPRSSFIPLHLRNTQHSQSPSPLSSEFAHRILESADEPQSAPAHSQTWRSAPSHVTRASLLTIHDRRSSHYSEPSCTSYDELVEHDSYDETIRRPLGPPPNSAPLSRSRPTSVVRPPMYAIATPSPTLMFAIASDDVEQVRQVLERGNAGPNDSVGPQSALEFAMTNDQLSHKMDIVKTLLAFGADPTIARKPVGRGSISDEQSSVDEEPKLMKSLIDDMDPATRYYVERADAAHTRKTSALIHRSFFRPLTRVRYELIGQDRALEQLFRVLSMHSRQLAMSPIVVLLSGPSGHGKSLLARKFGSLLDVPTHTVNMTTLRSTHDLWQSYSMSPYETPTTCTLAEFLINNEGKRCVVVLDEIEKAENEQTLFSLLMPWELGRCCFDANSRHVDVRNVIWLGTSNIAHDLVFEHHEARERPNELMSREEYVELMGLLRPRVSDKLGASVLSRVTTVLPFVPFTPDERKAICSEALFNLGGELVRDMSPKVVELVIDTALASYIPSEGARSLYRAISNQLVDLI